MKRTSIAMTIGLLIFTMQNCTVDRAEFASSGLPGQPIPGGETSNSALSNGTGAISTENMCTMLWEMMRSGAANGMKKVYRNSNVSNGVESVFYEIEEVLEATDESITIQDTESPEYPVTEFTKSLSGFEQKEPVTLTKAFFETLYCQMLENFSDSDLGADPSGSTYSSDIISEGRSSYQTNAGLFSTYYTETRNSYSYGTGNYSSSDESTDLNHFFYYEQGGKLMPGFVVYSYSEGTNKSSFSESNYQNTKELHEFCGIYGGFDYFGHPVEECP